MRIALFTEAYFPFTNGVVTHVDTLRKGLEAQGHQVMIVTLDPSCSHHYIQGGVLYCPAIPLKRLYGYGMANPLNLERLEIIRRFDPDILHIHTEFSMGIFGLFAARRLHKPVVYTLHTMYDDYLFYLAPHKPAQDLVRPAAHYFFKQMAEHATEVIGPSEKVVEFLRRCHVRRHVNIIPNIVDLSEFLPENVKESDIAAARAEMGILPGDTAICFVGRLGREKSVDVLINDFAFSFAGQSAYKLFLIGDGPERAALQKQIELLGVGAQVRLLGRIDHAQLPPYYAACDLFATASLSEINSISMLEAMASGLYVLQRLDVYNRRQITDGENGAHFETQTEFAALAQEEAALSPAARLARRAAVTQATKRYGPKEFLKAVTDVYARAIAEYRK
ncbi:MAG: glycosyltransferase [Faecalibacterium sp.]|nr:glycosyltransferase [Faecalibacterium sp.]